MKAFVVVLLIVATVQASFAAGIILQVRADLEEVKKKQTPAPRRVVMT